jgi:hypothetical protein
MHNRYIEAQLSSSFVFNETNKRFTILTIYPDIDNKEIKNVIIEQAFKPSTNNCCNIS